MDNFSIEKFCNRHPILLSILLLVLLGVLFIGGYALIPDAVVASDADEILFTLSDFYFPEYVDIDAEVIDVEIVDGSVLFVTYSYKLVTYEYVVDGVKYRKTDSESRSEYYIVGDVIRVKYKESDVANAWIPD